MPMNTHVTAEKLAIHAQVLGRILSERQAHLLAYYLEFLVKWNQRMNLVGPSTWEQVFETLIQDSWYLADLFVEQKIHPAQTLDLGAGAGLPGIPLRIFWQAGDYFLVEPRQKRVLFMQQAIIHLGLPKTTVFQGRMEDLPSEKRQTDLIVSRAFKPWRELLGYVHSYLKPQGQVLVMTNEPQPKDKVVGYTLELIQEYTVAQKKRYFWLFTLGRESFSQIGHK